MMYRSVLYYHNRALHTVHRLYFAFILGHIRVPHHFFGGPESSPFVCLSACTMTEMKKNVSKTAGGGKYLVGITCPKPMVGMQMGITPTCHFLPAPVATALKS